MEKIFTTYLGIPRSLKNKNSMKITPILPEAWFSTHKELSEKGEKEKCERRNLWLILPFAHSG